MMSWEEAIKLYKIQKSYHNVSWENANLLTQKTVDIGKRWIQACKKPNLFLHGNPGSGKTYFMTCLFKELILRGQRDMHFQKSEEINTLLLDAMMGRLFNNQGYPVFERDLLTRFSEYSILFIDDIGCEQDSERVKQQYYKIIDERIGNERPTVYTSNFTFDEVCKHFGERIASRLQLCYHVEFPMVDHRKQQEIPLI